MGNILVTGAAGFIGSRLVEVLHSRGHEVTGLDCFLPTLYSAQMKKDRYRELSALSGVKLIELDLLRDDLSGLDRFDVVVNEAAMPGLTKSWGDLELYIDSNLIALDKLMSASAGGGLQKFIQISTSSVYGRVADGSEEGTTHPFSPYGVSKLAAEHLGMAHLGNFGFPFSVLRYFSVYGPGQRPDMAYHRFLRAARDDDTITVYGDGEQRRTNTYVDDCVEATILAIEHQQPGEIHNVSGVESVSVNEALATISEVTGKALKVDYLPARPGDQRETRGDISKAQADWGYQPQVNFSEGISAQWEWIRELPAEYSTLP